VLLSLLAAANLLTRDNAGASFTVPHAVAAVIAGVGASKVIVLMNNGGANQVVLVELDPRGEAAITHLFSPFGEFRLVACWAALT
jgi:hypothetical protein